MTFIGRIKENSVIWRRWHGEGRTSGPIYGVIFTWEPGNVYRSQPLTTEQIEKLREHASIILETIDVDLPVEPPPTVARPEKQVPTRGGNTRR